jgi:lipoprotein NlpD
VEVQDLAELNNIMKPSDVLPGMNVYIPEKDRPPGYKKLPIDSAIASEESKSSRPSSIKRGRTKAGRSEPIKIYRGKFIWPLNGKVTSLFGMRGGNRHDGIDISAPQGTPIKASASGVVVFSGQMKGYGNLILIRHDSNFFTAYAHNRVNKMKKGQSVSRDQVIAEVGRTGRATGSHLHFEIREGQKARNPLFFLPER